MIRWVLIAPVICFLWGCMPIHAPDEDEKGSLSLSIDVSREISVTDARMLSAVFGKDEPDKIIYRLFTLNLPWTLGDTTRFDRITIAPPGDVSYSKKYFPTGKNDSLTIMIPDRNETPPDESSDFTLYLQGIRITGRSLIRSVFFVGGRGSFNIRPLRCTARYLLWDNNRNHPVHWGTIRTGARLFSTRCDWVDLLYEFCASLVKHTPFEKPQPYRSTSDLDSYEPRLKHCKLKW